MGGFVVDACVTTLPGIGLPKLIMKYYGIFQPEMMMLYQAEFNDERNIWTANKVQ